MRGMMSLMDLKMWCLEAMMCSSVPLEQIVFSVLFVHSKHLWGAGETMTCDNISEWEANVYNENIKLCFLHPPPPSTSCSSFPPWCFFVLFLFLCILLSFLSFLHSCSWSSSPSPSWPSSSCSPSSPLWQTESCVLVFQYAFRGPFTHRT